MTDASGFGGRYTRAVVERGRLCAGIDPHAALLEEWGLSVDIDGLSAFADICVEALGPVAAVIKPQVAFFEPFGSAGFAVLERVVAGCREAGALVIADAKRGDIGSTMAAYAQAWLSESSPLCADSVTASPYLGYESLRSALDLARSGERGVFVLARTSNPEGGELQRAQVGERTVAQSIVDAAAAENTDGTATVGLVVGATREHGLDLAGLRGPILAPGLGAQGATAADLPIVFEGADPAWVLPASSRGVLRAGPDPIALRDAFVRARDEVEAALG
ncbi:orotidine-5'-phosphate decarboxylase [Gordonia hongkongensis]|uniref:Orotidine 5'-phosphate decarboxylase n=1 Tax=Gordonia hongkongensis TaxID=1701090 RepID=A0AAX3TDX0_9ACTN|nr:MULTISPECIES: orotidine-5'-phosphate decarboxylase [Gordonia]OCW85587.1 orotidine 5'-phosphate decarboxylase [Nocardia farcinica]QIK48175.1 orotidine-5'-phosphate decarboxylase [Gordonia terrae]MBN0972150.1 orotidine-5'-phosphate decarboxylase [Gordonia sp. BP-119]MBN0982699.1 orotidine-5'-phosphate decarboxylase [Gordonia sp. BP-94]UCZ90535.1 orotidine-5'-phosphate decarboxylase [Gordonia sp. WA4-43]